AALHNHLFRLRRVLPDGAVESNGDGYRLDPARVRVDADRLVALVAGVEAGRDPSALAELDAVLARWHGPAYPELADVDDGRAESARLDELRVRAREARAERRLADGATPPDDLVAELTTLVDAEPLRERPRALLMAALDAAGRRVEALRVYDDFRRLLADELGIEPSPLLAARHAALLDGSVAPGGGIAPGPSPAAASTTAAGAGRWVPPGRLPRPPASLVGRDALVDELLATVAEHRVVTLVGPGGVGKTRLLVELGHRLRAPAGDRPVVLCELAPASEGSALDAVAAALGIDGRPGVGPIERLTAVVGDGEAVVLLDNCEHVLEPIAALVEQLTARCPGVAVVATSRERLRVPGEQVRAVPPLDAAGPDSTAARLFVERARAVTTDFAPGPGDRAVIAEVVGRLDGLPLAIELAAARLHTHDVAEVAAGLDHGFTLLSSGSRTSTRHGSLGAAISWSFELLGPGLQRAFADLSVFAGSFTVDDAAAVAGVDRAVASELLGQLCERSLVMRAPERRYVLLETLRAFGSEQLAAGGRVDEVRARHAHHQVAWVLDADRRLLIPGSRALAEIDAAVPELRAALGWLLEHGEVEQAGRMVVALFSYGFLRLRPDVLAWAEPVTRADPDDRSPEAAEVWVGAAYAAWMAGDMAATRSRRARALRVAGGDVADPLSVDLPAGVAGVSGACAMFDGDVDVAARWYGRAATLAAAHGDRAYSYFAGASELLALGYGGDPAAADRSEALLARTGDDDTAHA
ncbi:MAG TPA: BTAD domain-containing putative transcriptional regulator, partial [Actinomycetes bacterium]